MLTCYDISGHLVREAYTDTEIDQVIILIDNLSTAELHFLAARVTAATRRQLTGVAASVCVCGPCIQLDKRE